MSYPEFVKQLKSLKLKKKGNKSKVSPNKFYPSQAELQTNEVLKGELDDYARKLMKGALDNGVKGVYDVLGAPPESFKKEVDRIAKEVSDFNVKVFADFSNMVVGERYFPSTDKKDLILRTWKENFVNLCKSTNEEMRKKSAGIISDGVLSGRNLKEMVKELQNTCSDFSRNKAELIATTEIGKLNTAISKAQNESAGIKYYEWAAAMDGRTRESHASMDGRICAWDNDDVYYEWVEGKEGKRELKEFKRTEKMYHGAPGTDFRCRCVAIPYIPEFEDDYEQERTEGPIQGVVQERPENENIGLEKENNNISVDSVTKKVIDSMMSFGFIEGDEEDESKKELKEKISRMPDRLRKLWIKKASEINIEKIGRPPAHCSSDGKSIYLCGKRIDTVIHEIGHATSIGQSDENFEISLKSRLSPMKAMSATLSGTLKDRCLQINIGSTAYKEFVQGLNKDLKDVYSYKEKRALVEDMLSSSRIKPNEAIMSCISDWLSLSGYEDFGWGHPKNYQKRFRDVCKYFELPQEQCSRAALSIELGAEIPEILSSEDGRKFLESFLPKTLKQYEDNVL